MFETDGKLIMCCTMVWCGVVCCSEVWRSVLQCSVKTAMARVHVTYECLIYLI